MITAVLLFTLLLHLHPERWPRPVKSSLVFISKVSFGLYLVSWIADQIVYGNFLNPHVMVVSERWKYYLAAVPASFLLSLGMSTVLSLVQGVRRMGWALVKSRK